MTSQGHPGAILKRALEQRDLPGAWAAAYDMPAVALDDGLDICLLLAEHWTERYAKAAARWLGRYVSEVKGVTLSDASLVAGHLLAIGGEDKVGAQASLWALAALLDGRHAGCAARLRRAAHSEE